MNYIDLTGQTFGRLTVIGYDSSKMDNNKSRAYWNCKCKCGNTKIISSRYLRSGDVLSCGCLRREIHEKKPYEWIYTMLLYQTKSRTNGFSDVMSFEEFLEFTKITQCHYCNESITWHKHRTYKNPNILKYHLDRKDNLVGYTKENCVVCCTLCNFVKGKQLTYDEMLIVGKSVTEVQKIRRNRLTVSIPPECSQL